MEARGDARGAAGSPGRPAEGCLLAVFCCGVPGRENGGRPAYGFAVASCTEPEEGSRKPREVRRTARGGGTTTASREPRGGVFHSHAALLGDGIDGAVEAARPSASLGAEALVAVSEYRAAGAALGWLEERGLSRERIFLFTGSKTLARCEEEPLGVWRAFRRPVEGEALKEVLGAVARFGDLSAEW